MTWIWIFNQCKLARLSDISSHPLLAAEGAIFGGALFGPLENAVQVKVVIALALDGDALVPGHLACRAGWLESILTNGAWLCTLDVPFPGGHRLPAVNFDLHIIIFTRITVTGRWAARIAQSSLKTKVSLCSPYTLNPASQGPAACCWAKFKRTDSHVGTLRLQWIQGKRYWQ